MEEYSILIVDDDVWMQRILSKVLEGFGFETFIATNGYDGVALALEHKPLVIFLDIMMPELTGHMTLKILKRILATQDIPVLMISALSDTENLGLAVKTGAVGFISKPFTRATIFDKLKNVVGSDLLNDVTKRSQMSAQELKEAKQQEKEKAEQNAGPVESDSTIPGRSGLERNTAESSPSPSEASRRYKEESKQQQIDVIKELLLKDKK